VNAVGFGGTWLRDDGKTTYTTSQITPGHITNQRLNSVEHATKKA